MRKKAMWAFAVAVVLAAGSMTAKASDAESGAVAEMDAADAESAESNKREAAEEFPAATNLRWEGEYAVWDPVPGAEYYMMDWYEDGENMGKDETTYTEPRARIPSIWNGVYQFSVRAFGDDYFEFSESERSEELVIDRPPFKGGKLPTPTGLRWADNWTIEWDRMTESQGYYRFEVYKDGEYYTDWSEHVGVNCGSYSLSDIIKESGIYTWRIQATNDSNTEDYIDSEWSEFCEEKEYVRPNKTLGTFQGHWSDTEAGKFVIDITEDKLSDSYDLSFQLYDGDELVANPLDVSHSYSYDGNNYYCNFPYDIDFHGEGWYRVRIRALSNNIDEIVNGEWGEFSEYLDTSKIAQIVGGSVRDAISSTASAGDALEKIKYGTNNSMNNNIMLRMSMQVDNAVREQMKNLEASYVAENGISVNKTDVLGEAGNYVTAEDISMVGAGLNAGIGQSVKLEISVPEEKKYVSPQDYADSVQLNIQLKRNEESVYNLQIPITITLPIPGGLDASRLAILLYDSFSYGRPIMPKINEDGTVTFTLTRFSTFVFAEEKSEELNGWQEEDRREYWYEDDVKQGTEGRGKEIYDPDSDAWYWLDAVQGGAKAVSKDVYQESSGGKWVRYDENGHMIKGWQETDAGTYYFDLTTGAMYKGLHNIDGTDYYFDETTGILGQVYADGWNNIDGVDYWYENGTRQGYDPENPAYRGKEIYDPASDAWYWLDNVQQGAKAVSKDVYQESYSAYPDREDGTGKWVRYDESGHMVKGWQTTDAGTYYFEPITGAMAKGQVTIDGASYYFDGATGILK